MAEIDKEAEKINDIMNDKIENHPGMDLDGYCFGSVDLPPEDAFKIINDVLEIPDFWPNSSDDAAQRNYSTLLSSPSILFSPTFGPPILQPELQQEKLLGLQLATL